YYASASSVICTLSLHDALPICRMLPWLRRRRFAKFSAAPPMRQSALTTCVRCWRTLALQNEQKAVITSSVKPVSKKESICNEMRSEEHTSELQSRSDLVCRLLL